jgi:tRNA(fMet)-specific endonuclease VapC
VTLLDTNVFIRFVKGDSAVADWLARSPRTELAVPAIVLYELEYGSLKARFSTRRRDILQHGLEQIEHIPFDTRAALEAAKIRIQLEEAGVVIGPLDLLIAGTAVSRTARLATSNIREFSRIVGLQVVPIPSGSGSY